MLCDASGKLFDEKENCFHKKEKEEHGTSLTTVNYQTFYHANPVVPADYSSVQAAVDHIMQLNDGRDPSSPRSFRVLLKGGEVHQGNLTLKEPSGGRLLNLKMQVTPPRSFAAMISPPAADSAAQDVPLVTVNGDSIILEVDGVCFIHFSPGRNIWNGNSCFFVAGGDLKLSHCEYPSRFCRFFSLLRFVN